MNLFELLAEYNVISGADRERFEAYTAQNQGNDISSPEELLLRSGLEAQKILDALSAYYKVPSRMLGDQEKIEPSVLQHVPVESAKHYRIVPLSVRDGVLEVGCIDPDNLDMVDALNFISTKVKLPYKLVVILERDFKRGITMYENLAGEVNQALTALESELSVELIDSKENETKSENEEEIKEDAPVTRIVATILRYAVDGKASDIHIEPTEEKVRIRFRVDGVLVKSLELPMKIHSAVVARIKILSSIRLDEKRKPQDGRFSASIDGHRIDFRVSSLPTYHGEKIVMRILDPEHGARTFQDLGISEDNLVAIRRAVQKPYGIILISGPTGSGKSTTLYAMLQEVDKAGKNVISLEDPVEYNIDGVAQSQVRPEIGYTFAAGLRSVLRQDPDIIMVGEIRDKETAQLAIQAALTGHLVLSTIHTNNAVGVIPRLIDMGVDPYLIAPTLVLAMAQRLVRRICPNSGREEKLEGSSLGMLFTKQFETLPSEFHVRIPKQESILRVQASPECPNGTRGRTAVLETLEITQDIEQLILNNGTETQIYEAARKKGFVSMYEDALMKALRHEIPFEEVNGLGGSGGHMITIEEDLEVSSVPPVDNASMNPEVKAV
jgi:type IV pilus assembly protein PilB